jgi:hypothetical protein
MGLFTGSSKWDRFHYDRRMKLIPVTANTTTTIVLTLESIIEPGSIISQYNLFANENLVEDLTVSFSNSLGLQTGGSILIVTGVTISQGESSGTTTVIVNEDFNNLNRISVISGVTFSSDEGFYLPQITPDIIFASQTPTPTVTPTMTPTPSVTPGESPTPTNTPTSTITPTVTQMPTNTPTGSVTPTVTQTPTITTTQTTTPTNTQTPSVTQTPTNTPTGSMTPTPTNTPTSSEAPPIPDNFTWSFDDQSESENNTYRILLNGNVVVNEFRTSNGSFLVRGGDLVRIILTYDDGRNGATSDLTEDLVNIYSGSSPSSPDVLDSGAIGIKGGSVYVATAIINP